jgi:glycosyltransferase involved in cell wall biosynthesis
MKICLIGPGIMSIPPKGWGAVESLIWDYYINLRKLNQDVSIINTQNINEIISIINKTNPDFVHIMYDQYIDIVKYINPKIIVAYTSHYGYLTQEKYIFNTNYYITFQKVFEYVNRIFIFALSKEIKDIYVKYGFPENKVFITPNGANTDFFKFNEVCVYPDKSIYLAKIEMRKCQYKYQNNKSIDFVGNYANSSFNKNNTNYIGEWDKNVLYNTLTNYANLILLSNGEADPLVVKEALICGLGIVASKTASANLDINLPFIDVVKDEDLDNIEKVNIIIENNRKKSIGLRYVIREYGLNNFNWLILIEKYLKIINNIQMLSSITLVTCYYKVPSKHSHIEYDKWIHNFFSIINCNIVVYTSDDLIDYIKKVSFKNKNVTIISKNFNELEVLQKYPDIWDNQYLLDPQKNIRTKECYILWNSKLNFIKEAIHRNVYNSSKFIWADIGCIRVNNMNFLKLFPKYSNISENKIDITLIKQFNYSNFNQKYFFNEIHLSGSIYGGNKDTMITLCKLYYKYFDDYVKENKFIGCDQQILSTCYILNKDLFNLILVDNNKIDSWFYLLYEYSK